MWVRRCVLVIGCFVAATFAAVPAAADMLYGASPASLVFDGGGQGLLRGASADRSLSLQNQGDDDLTFALALEGPAGSWLSVAATSIDVPPRSSETIKVRATVPETASNGLYQATVRITPVVTPENGNGGASSTIVQEIRVPARIEVTDVQTLKLTIGRLSVPDTEQGGRLFVEIDATNDGNVEARPDVTAIVFDEAAEGSLGTFEGRASAVAPQTTTRLLVDLGPHRLQVGSYAIRLETTLEGGEVAGGGPREFFFDVLPPGTLAIKIDAVRLTFGEGKTHKGDLVPVRLSFLNKGDTPAVVGFTGVVSKGGKPVDELRLDPVEVASGQRGTLEGFWRAAGAGTYELAGQLTVGAKRVDVTPATVSVAATSNDSPAPGLSLLIPMAAAALFVLRRRS